MAGALAYALPGVMERTHVSDQGTLPEAIPAEKPQGNALTRWFKRQSTFGKIRIVVVALAVVIGGPIAYFAAQSAPAAANLGDCMSGQTADTLKKVACTEATAEWVSSISPMSPERP